MSKIRYTIAELSERLGAKPLSDSDTSIETVIEGIGTLESATATQLSFLHNSKYQHQLSESDAGAVLVREEFKSEVNGVALVVADPYLAYARATALFVGCLKHEAGISDTAIISETAVVADDAQIGQHVVLGNNVVIGSGVVVGSNTVIGDDCIIGDNTRLAANVTLYRDVKIGADCVIHSGAVIGADGFGFASHDKQWVKIHQLGGVRIGDSVEVGAGTTIDRGALEDTIIHSGVILDNQIQIAHNVEIGENTAIAGCTAVAGSTTIGKNCTIAGACGITGHLEIAEGVHVTAMSLVSKSLTKPGAYSSGTVVEPHQQWKRNVVRFRQLDDLSRRVKTLETIAKQNKIEGQS